MHLLLFAVGALRRTLPAAAVTEVIRAVSLIPVREQVVGVAGLIDVHGTLMPVVDLRPLLDQPPRALDPDEHFIIIEADGRPLVLRTDGALDVLEAPAGPDVPPLPAIRTLLPPATRDWLDRGAWPETARAAAPA
jgi:chemotaxis signal transduction protein